VTEGVTKKRGKGNLGVGERALDVAHSQTIVSRQHRVVQDGQEEGEEYVEEWQFTYVTHNIVIVVLSQSMTKN